MAMYLVSTHARRFTLILESFLKMASLVTVGGNDYEDSYNYGDQQPKVLNVEKSLSQKLKELIFDDASVLMISLNSGSAKLTLLYDGIGIGTVDNQKFYQDDFGRLNFAITTGTPLQQLAQNNVSICLVCSAIPDDKMDGVLGNNNVHNYYKNALQNLRSYLERHVPSSITFLSSDARRAVEAAVYFKKGLNGKVDEKIYLFPCVHSLGPGQRDGDILSWRRIQKPLEFSHYRKDGNLTTLASKVAPSLNMAEPLLINDVFYKKMYSVSSFHCHATDFFRLLIEFRGESFNAVQPKKGWFRGGVKRSVRTKQRKQRKTRSRQ